MDGRHRAGVPGGQEEREECAFAVTEHAEATVLDVLLRSEEAERGRGLLLVGRDADGIGVGGVGAQSRLPAAQLVVAKGGNAVCRQPVGQRLERVDVAGIVGVVAVAVGGPTTCDQEDARHRWPRRRVAERPVHGEPAGREGDVLVDPGHPFPGGRLVRAGVGAACDHRRQRQEQCEEDQRAGSAGAHLPAHPIGNGAQGHG